MTGAGGSRVSGGELLARSLAAVGITDLFGVPAGKMAPFAKAVARVPRFRPIGVRHEAAAAWMATAVFHATGRVAACFGECGPGSLNLVSGLGSAKNNGLAVLALTTGNPTHVSYPFRGMFMELDERQAFGAVTKWGATVDSPERIPELVGAAVREALGGRPGPVQLELPADVLAAEVDEASVEIRPLGEPRPPRAAEADEVATAAALLVGARHPLVVAGGGAVLSEAAAAIRALVERLGAAATATQMGLGVFPSDHPGLVGHGGIVGGPGVVRAFAEADVVLAVGCRFSSWLWEGSLPLVGRRPGQQLIRIDIDPGRFDDLAGADVALLGDARTTVEALSAAIGGGDPAADGDWVRGLVEEGRAHRAGLVADPGGERLHPGVATAALAAALPADALVTYDGGHTTFWCNDLIPVQAPRTRFHEPGMAHLGFGLPYALALQLTHPGRPVVNVTGDGAFGFTLAELDTARRNGLPVVTVVMDNAAWGVIGFGQRRQGFELGTDLSGTDYAAIARAFGCHGETVSAADEIAPALARALASELPAVLTVEVRFEPHPSLPRFAQLGK